MKSIFKDIYINIISDFLGVDLKRINKLLNSKKLESSGKIGITDNIDKVSRKLEESKEIINDALIEMENQKRAFEEIKKEAETSTQIASMNKEQISALNDVLESTLNAQEKKSLPKTLLINFFFCVLSAVLGFVLGKYL